MFERHQGHRSVIEVADRPHHDRQTIRAQRGPEAEDGLVGPEL